MDSIVEQIVIEEVKLSEILAMFLAIVDTLMLIGILCSMISSSILKKDLANIYIKNEYKTTAL